MIGIPVWDSKADGIGGGRPGCSVICPMGCCMVTRSRLGEEPEWIQRRKLDDMIASCFCRVELDTSVYDYVQDSFPLEAKELIAKCMDHMIVPDPPNRSGAFCSTNLYEKYKHVSSDGGMGMGQADLEEASLQSGSIWYDPIMDTPGEKLTGGNMHVNNGHINHFIRSIMKKVRGWRDENCDWQRYVANFKRDLNKWREETEDSRPLANSDLELKINVSTLHGRITRARTTLMRLDNIDFPIGREI